MSLQTVARTNPNLYVKEGKRYLPARVAKSIRKRNFSVPLLTTSALVLGTWDAFESLQRGNTPLSKARLFGYHLLKNYTGIHLYFSGQVKWKPRTMMKGLLPLVLVMMINKSGVMRKVNTNLANKKIPLRLS